MFERKGTLLLPLFSRSYKLTHQPHAVWLSAPEHKENLTTLQNVLTLSQQQGAIPELVLYTIPNRDLGKASQGGAVDGKTYLTHNMEIAKILKLFIMKTDRHPVIYLEPDAIAHLLPAIYRRPPDMYPSWVKERLWLLKQSVELFKQVGCKVFLDVGHSQWVASQQQRQSMVELLLQAGLQQACGIISNVSNFQPLSALLGLPAGEAHYLKELALGIRKVAPALNLQLKVDASRSLLPEIYVQLIPRKFILCPKGGLLEQLPNNSQRRLGHWQGDCLAEATVFPELGVSKSVEQLVEQESYTLLENELTAPVWLDPLLPSGKTPLGILPPQRKIEGVETRWIKPPDEADGCLPYHAGASVSLTDKDYQKIN